MGGMVLRLQFDSASVHHEKTAVGREDVVFERAGSRKSWPLFLQLTERLTIFAEGSEWIGSRPL